MTPAERVSAIDLALTGNRPLVWSQDGVNFRADTIEIVHDGEAISANVTAWTGNGANLAIVPVDNPVILVNPPVFVPYGEPAIITNEDGEMVSVPTYRKDPLAAYKTMLARTVLTVAESLGWS